MSRAYIPDKLYARILESVPGMVGLDVSIRTLEATQRRLKVDRLPTTQANRLKLIHGSLTYRERSSVTSTVLLFELRIARPFRGKAHSMRASESPSPSA